LADPLPVKTVKVIFQYLQIGQRVLASIQRGPDPISLTGASSVTKQQRPALIPIALRPTAIDNARVYKVYKCDTFGSHIG
jgi:hypothetical protein